MQFGVRTCKPVGDIHLGYHTKGPHDVSSGMTGAHTAAPGTGVRVIRNEVTSEEIGYHR
jgi:hypothetical protein